jgi:parallel beta-helix repeat protein
MKKIINFGILIIFALSCFLPSVIGFSFKSESQAIEDIIIVDDEGDGDYIRIKDALNYADPGDIIEVYSGTYYEYGIIIKDEDITLKGIPYELGHGYDEGKPYINGEGKDVVITIIAKNNIITGFRIENSGGTIACGIISIRSGANNCLISNNDISYSIMGCIGCSSNNNRFIKNNISNSAIRQGIVLGGKNNTITDNVISDVEIGIDLWDSNYNTITDNKISSCREFGIDIASSNYNIIDGNTFEDNTVGVQIYYSLGSRIKNNNFIDNNRQAQFLYGLILYGFTNRWNGNYWNGSHLLPYPIRGVYFFFPWIQFDWRPALKSYDL